ncbi:Hypothetical predicted protein [Olea europaea subsp. europaea]|uniref:Pollen Ole e 1 allergen and extensin family protein n=1 Tax=Olea europaea subsp. europaea TaxID=158383 RepID=A0A8S0Q6E6_OLEEU|nr:Hypothetical predicted protein [Olea europaea subsp. europaea]
MSQFCSMDSLVKMVFFNFILFCLGTAMAEQGNFIIEPSSRKDSVNWAGYGEEKLSTVVISGKVICQSKASMQTNPISGASVAVLCGTPGTTSKSWAEGTTDDHGEFFLDLPSHLHAIPNLERICCVKVHHLPESSPCQQSFTEKHKGIKLTSIGEGIRTYTTHNIHLVPHKRA